MQKLPSTKLRPHLRLRSVVLSCLVLSCLVLCCSGETAYLSYGWIGCTSTYERPEALAYDYGVPADDICHETAPGLKAQILENMHCFCPFWILVLLSNAIVCKDRLGTNVYFLAYEEDRLRDKMGVRVFINIYLIDYLINHLFRRLRCLYPPLDQGDSHTRLQHLYPQHHPRWPR
jgi:hypothetical protein